MPIEFVGDNRHQDQDRAEPLPDPGERRAAEQTAQLDELERRVNSGLVSQQTAGMLRAVEHSASDYRVAARARELRGRARVQPLTQQERRLYSRDFMRREPRSDAQVTLRQLQTEMRDAVQRAARAIGDDW